MQTYKNFKAAAYVHAQFLYYADERDVQRGIDYFERYMPLNKVYLETHRGLYDVPAERMKAFKKLFIDRGIEVSGGITSTIKIDGYEKNNIFDVFCFSDPVYRERYMQIVRDTASLFDEIILDDFFFTACRCEMCIEKKRNRTWAEFRLEQMEQMSREIVNLAKSVNPGCNFIIKYPNWYESYQECGYNPGRQKDIFDMVHTGTETRDPRYSQQHLQRYLSYSLIRLMENIAPGRNGGGWIDQYDSYGNMNMWLEQAYLTIFAGARELTLFNFEDLIDSPALPPLGQQLERVDSIMGKVGKPIGVSFYEPYDADGEDQVMNYLGMVGLPIEPTPEFDSNELSILLAASAAKDEDIMEKLERYVREGGTAAITSGFLRAVYDRGIKDMTSVSLTTRRVSGKEYWIDSYYMNHKTYADAAGNASFEVLDYKTNATWCEVAMISGDCSFPVLLHEFYGRGHLYILNIPDNFSHLYNLPGDVLGYINKSFSRGRNVYMNTAAKYNLFLYDNDTIGVISYRPYTEDMEVVLRGEKYVGLRDLETGREYFPVRENLHPAKRFDSAKTQIEPVERVMRIPIKNGAYRFFSLIKE
ncbi:MAG: hypothetical protein Q8930_07445 [Bacillota bacterium]|nr:hypothetical protein [Bacillota bacterium]